MATATQRLKEALDRDELTARERQKLLGASRPRLVLEILDRETTVVDLETLAAEVARREDGVDVTDDATVKRVAKTLRYDHLPTMAEVGVLDYDPEANLVEPVEGSPERQYA